MLRREQGSGRHEQGASRVYWLREQARAGARRVGGAGFRGQVRAGAGRTSQSASRGHQLFERGADSGGGYANRPT
jgi:hypothetical protein